MKIAKKVNCAPRLIASYTNLNLVSPFSNLFLQAPYYVAPIANKKNGKTRSTQVMPDKLASKALSGGGVCA